MLFEQAARLKLRFETPKGLLSVEDLWDLPLMAFANRNYPNLDSIARGLYDQLKETTTVSFVVKAPQKDEILQLKFDIVKHIIDVLLAEKEKAKEENERREKKARLLAMVARKQDEQLEQKTLEDLQKELQEL